VIIAFVLQVSVIQVPGQNTTLLSLEDGPKEYVDELELELEQVLCSWRFMLTIEVEWVLCVLRCLSAVQIHYVDLLGV
jgi:hypothetical protein